MDIYADGRGVFVLESILNEVFTAPPFEDGLTVHFNDGTGWIPWHDLPAEPGVVGADSLAGVESGPLFLWSGGCPLERLDGPDAAECEYADAEVIAAAPTGPDELYVITHGPELALVGIVSGVATTLDTLSSTSIVNGLWGTSTDAIVLLSDGLRHGTPTSGLEPMPAPPSADELTTISGSAIDDLWVGTFGADLFHWDGSSWSGPTDTGLAEPLVSLWLDGDTVYFAGDGGFGRRNVDGSVEVIFEVPLDYRGAITAMTGNGDRGEVYLSLVDADFYDYACGPAMLIVYDGVTLRRF